MKKEFRYILSQEDATCIGDIRTARADLKLMADKIIKEDNINLEYANFMNDVSKLLEVALEKLKIEEK